MPDHQAEPDTFPRLLLANAERLGDRPAVREKDLGIWQTWTWREVAAEVRTLACGLAALGFKRGDAFAARGPAYDAAHPDFYPGEVAEGKASDTGVMLYTSGTTGKPKGVCQPPGAFLVAARGGAAFHRLGPADSMLSYLPMAWVGD